MDKGPAVCGRVRLRRRVRAHHIRRLHGIGQSRHLCAHGAVGRHGIERLRPAGLVQLDGRDGRRVGRLPGGNGDGIWTAHVRLIVKEGVEALW